MLGDRPFVLILLLGFDDASLEFLLFHVSLFLDAAFAHAIDDGFLHLSYFIFRNSSD